jgi:hypothetical protein
LCGTTGIHDFNRPVEVMSCAKISLLKNVTLKIPVYFKS